MTNSTVSRQSKSPITRLERWVAALEAKLSGKWWIEVGLLAIVSIVIAPLFGR